MKPCKIFSDLKREYIHELKRRRGRSLALAVMALLLLTSSVWKPSECDSNCSRSTARPWQLSGDLLDAGLKSVQSGPHFPGRSQKATSCVMGGISEMLHAGSDGL